MTQIPSLGTFGPQCLGAVGRIPTFVALLVVVLRYGAAPVWHRRPVWLRNFAAEEAPVSSCDEEVGGHGSPRRVRAWTAPALTLLVLSFVTAAIGVAGAFFSLTSAQLPWMPIVPSVSERAPAHVYGKMQLTMSSTGYLRPDTRS